MLMAGAMYVRAGASKIKFNIGTVYLFNVIKQDNCYTKEERSEKMETDNHKPTLMQIQFKLPIKLACSLAIMVVMILTVYLLKIPNPNMILIAGLVLCSALFGYNGGGIAAAIMLFYTLYFFSTDHSFTRFTPENIQKVFVSLIGIAADMFFVCKLKQAEIQAFEKVAALTKELKQENELLQHMSKTDALTGLRNRMALLQDYDSYMNHEVTVMMLDLNDFKLINDTRGHEEGNRIIQEIGKLLSDNFGREHCYRYGGDEFLVIVPDIPSAEFDKKLENLKQNRPTIDSVSKAAFSIGFVRAMLTDSDMLRNLISKADEKMYESKREKNQYIASGQVIPSTQMQSFEYTVEELKEFLKEMSEKYALARVVDPIECRVIELKDDGRININESCYGIWDSEHKCINCSSSLACRTGCHQEKAEHFKDNYYFVQSNPVKLKLSNGSVYNAVVELVNVKKESNVAANNREAENIGTRAAHYIARHDSLTNVLNSDAFYELTRGMIKNNPDKSWVMITSNIMNFRLVNTLFGEQKGNEVLARTASMLREVSESSRGLCGRLGSDQFGVLIPSIAYKEERLTFIAQTLADTYNCGIYKFHIHLGVYEIDDPSIPVSVMCGRSNSALRTIRDDLTRTVAYFDDTILQKIIMEQTVLGSFDEALRSGQFRMYLQPQVRKDGSVIGAEALVRWMRPDGSMIMPGDFIETLETAGLIHKLDRYMWELAVKQLHLWKGTDKKCLSISVNVSAKDFYSIDVARTLTELVDQYGVDSRMLRLEITETAFLGEPDKYKSIVTELREKGFLVEIDDFGKGNSTLSFLKDIKADVLKIDMSLLQEIKDNERNQIILKSVISMADSLGMDVITEGIETEEQLRILTEMGCNHFQGYFFCRPVSVDVFEEKYF